MGLAEQESGTMSLMGQVNSAIKSAMKNRDKVSAQALKNLKADLQNYEIANKGNDMDYLSVVQKFIKQRQSAADIYKNANSMDRYQEEMNEAALASKFLPEQLSKKALLTLVEKRVSENNFSSIREMGKLMGILKAELKGSADMKLLGQLCKNALNKYGILAI